MLSETIVFNGITFHRYPESPKWADRYYFTPGKASRARGVGRLHEEVWKAHNGAIPDGCVIHHIDRNPLNNDIANLQCLPIAEHKAIHAQEASLRGRSPERLALLARNREKTAAWHRSAEGRAWHSEHGKRVAACIQPVERTCEYCGAVYLTKKQGDGVRFCSNKCKVRWRYHAGLDNEERTCAHCGKSFWYNKYQPKRFCSRECSIQGGSKRGPRPK